MPLWCWREVKDPMLLGDYLRDVLLSVQMAVRLGVSM